MNRKVLSAAATFGAASVIFSAAAMAQTATPGGTATVVATGTASASTTAVASGTAAGTSVATGTAGATGTVSSTGTVTGTVQAGTAVPTVGVSGSIYQAGGTGNFAYADPAFRRLWDRTDSLVASGAVKRTFFWGPGPNSVGLIEPYKQGPSGQHLVQYFDKSRMEINNPSGNRDQQFFVTNGLLTVDLIAGSIQVGDADFTTYHPACIPMSGDFGDQLAPTYFAFQKVSVNNNRQDTHQAQNRTGQKVMETIDRNGNTGTDASKGNIQGANLVQFVNETKHNIPQAFWTFLNSSGPVHDAAGKTVSETLQMPYFFAAGYPISEAYWAKATINGKTTDVMIQAYERRALTYVPTNPVGFQVEVANIGQHYFDWRYRNFGVCPATSPSGPVGTPVVAPTGTAQANTTATVSTTATANATADRGTPHPTGTANVGVTSVPTGTAGAGSTATAGTTSTTGPTIVTTQTVAPVGTAVP